MNKTFLLSLVLCALAFQVSAQNAPSNSGNMQYASLSGESSFEYATGALFFYERNWGIRGVGLFQEGRFNIDPHVKLTAGLGAIQAINAAGTFGPLNEPDFEGYSSIMGEVGLHLSPFSQNGRFQIGIGGVYQYGAEAILSGYAYDYQVGDQTYYQKFYDTSVINRLGYTVGASYQLWRGERFTARTALKFYTFDADFFAEITTISLQAGYRF